MCQLKCGFLKNINRRLHQERVADLKHYYEQNLQPQDSSNDENYELIRYSNWIYKLVVGNIQRPDPKSVW